MITCAFGALGGAVAGCAVGEGGGAGEAGGRAEVIGTVEAGRADRVRTAGLAAAQKGAGRAAAATEVVQRWLTRSAYAAT